MSMTELDVENTEPSPSLEQNLQKAEQVLKGEAPLIPPAPDVIVHLPRGYYRDGKWETDVEVRELNGNDEEALARFKEIQDFFNGVIVYGIARIGSTDLVGLPFSERSSILASLLIGEREQLFVDIARVTYGDEKDFQHTCPSCQAEVDTTVILSEDLKPPEMENPGKLTYTLTTTKGKTLSFRLATGADQMVVLNRKGATTAEQNTLMIAECVDQVDGMPVVDPMEMARGLSMGDRRRLLEILVESQPSPTMELKIPCASCGFEMRLALQWGDIFRP